MSFKNPSSFHYTGPTGGTAVFPTIGAGYTKEDNTENEIKQYYGVV